MNVTRSGLWPLAVLLAVGCGDDGAGTPDAGTPEPLGETTVDLSLAEVGTRAKETPIGNLVADAYLEAVAAEGVVGALVNGGGLRCPEEQDATQCADYKIPAGPITQAQLDIVLPFDNDLVIKTVTGAQLKSTLERSVATIPSEKKGWFLHVAGLSYEADCTRAAQQLNTEGDQIVTEGDRVTAIRVGGADYDPTAEYKVVAAAFVGAGNDGHVELGQATTTMSSAKEHQAMIDYLKAYSPITPKVEGRIVLTSCE